MPNQLPIPEELQHLIEKRTDDDRRNCSDAPAEDVIAEPPDKKTANNRRIKQRRKR